MVAVRGRFSLFHRGAPRRNAALRPAPQHNATQRKLFFARESIDTMRVNMDSSIITDARFKLVAAALGCDWKEVIGSCFLVWQQCYDRRSKCLRVVEIDIAAEKKGFADALCAEKLATDNGDGTVIVHGVEERIEFLKKQAAKGAKGGKSKRKQEPSKRLSKRQAYASGAAKADQQADASGVAKAYPLALTHDHTLTLAPEKGEPERLSLTEFRDAWCEVFAEHAGHEYVLQPAGQDPARIAAVAKLAADVDDFRTRCHGLWKLASTWTGEPTPTLELLAKHWNSCAPRKPPNRREKVLFDGRAQ